MKTHPPIRGARRAFTLIELITVISIIAILMSLLIPVIASVREAARRTKASTVIHSIVSSCKNYTSDYGKYPAIDGALTSAASAGGGKSDDGAYYSYGDKTNGKCKVNNSQLFEVLRGIAKEPNADHKLNRRQQHYFEDEKAKDGSLPREGFADGKDFADDIQGQLLDPWGKQYCVILDADGDGDLKLTDFFKDQTEVIRQPAVAFSMAKDNDIGGKGYQGRLQKEGSKEVNDIVSWQ
jgi:prepilin-type N-terminal cleavage/methylation domain-containing protein